MSKLPSKDEILAYVADNPSAAAKRDIARAFGIKGAARIDLKRMLKELEAEGHLTRRRKDFRDPETLPPVSVLEVGGADGDGDLFAHPLEWAGTGAEPRIRVLPRAGDPALGKGDRILARLTPTPQEEGEDYTARLIRRIGSSRQRIVAIFRKGAEGGRLMPIDKREQKQWVVPAGAEHGAADGELVEAEQMGAKGRMGLPKARITTRLGQPGAPKSASLIAIHQHGIPDEFPPEVLAAAEAARPAPLGTREDLRDLPLITIDPADARDRDDAVHAAPDPDPANEGGFILTVAIADVAHYVRPGAPLDIEARKRGNSTYFPDRVVPMLPDALSGDLCSLHEGVDRAVLAVRMTINAQGQKLRHQFLRAMMRSAASVAYEEVQAAMDGRPSERLAPLLGPVLKPLYAAYEALKIARKARQPLELDLPERQIVLSDEGKVTSVAFKERLEAHKLIEEYMVLANVAAAEDLVARKQPLLFRVHDEPAPEKLEALRELAEASGFTLAKGQVIRPAHLNRLLEQAEGTDAAELINISTLRSMAQASYAPHNLGHFGLALRNYAHFTSPIRRYADLVVHRALIAAHRWGKDGLTLEEADELEATGEHISNTERRSMLAERDTTDRYLAAYMAERVGVELEGRIAGIARFGVFVKLTETGADVMIPIRTLGAEFFHYDQASQTLTGDKSGQVIGLGQRATVRLTEAVAETGGMIADLVRLDARAMARGPARRAGTAPRRGAAKAKAAAKAKKKKLTRLRSRR